MPNSVEVCCKWCSRKFIARTADRKRGWARFCSKACKAKEQEKRTGQHAAYIAEQRERDNNAALDDIELGWDGHKNAR